MDQINKPDNLLEYFLPNALNAPDPIEHTRGIFCRYPSLSTQNIDGPDLSTPATIEP